ncbi:MAG: hypothetical protein HY245_06720, partial [Rhizobiales bacterium]|nr:hypothetical protein [Hyphomicrobiales bacterium]
AGAFADLVNMIGGAFLDSGAVAELGVGIRLAALVGFISQATQNFVLPDLAAALTRGDRAETRQLLLRINILALTAIGGCILVAMSFGSRILTIFGADYADAAWPLVLLMVGQGLRAASGMNQHLLSLGGYQARTAGACLVAVATLIAGAAMLAPQYGVMGMAAAAVAADLVWAVLLAAQAQRFVGRRGDILALIRAGA